MALPLRKDAPVFWRHKTWACSRLSNRTFQTASKLRIHRVDVYSGSFCPSSPPLCCHLHTWRYRASATGCWCAANRVPKSLQIRDINQYYYHEEQTNNYTQLHGWKLSTHVQKLTRIPCSVACRNTPQGIHRIQTDKTNCQSLRRS